MNGKQVLVADDDDTAIMAISMMFKALQVQVIVAKDGKQALDAYKSIKGSGIAYVLMDIHMPIMDGYESTKQIRAFEKAQGLPACKILGLSAGQIQKENQLYLDFDQKTKDSCFGSGMNDLVSKPVKKDKLAAHL